MVFSAKSDDSNTISQFTRKKVILVTTTGTNVPSNYQVKLIIQWENEMQADFDDLRFNTKTNGYIDYWIETYTASTTATVWVELPDTITHPGSDYIWMYYGNQGLSDGGVGGDAFILFNSGSTLTDMTETDTSGSGIFSIDSGTIRATGIGTERNGYLYFDNPTGVDSYIIEAEMKPSARGGDNIQHGFRYDSSIASGDKSIYRWLEVNSRFNIYSGLLVSTNGDVDDVMSLNWKKWKLIKNGNTKELWWDETKRVEHTESYNGRYVAIYFYDNGSSTSTWYKNIFIRKYIANEPTPSYGIAQHQRRISQFIG